MRERGAGFYHGLAIAAVVIWGTTFVSTKVLLTEGLSPAAIMFLRFLIAYAVLRTVCPRNERPVRFKDELMFAAAGITGGSMYFLTENMALQITLVSNVALLLTTSPIMTVLLSRLFFRRTEPFGRPVVLGMLVALAGVALVVYNGNFILQIRPWGDLLTLTATLMWAFYNIVLKKIDRRYTTLEITRKVFFYGLATLLPVFFFTPLRLDAELLLRPAVWGNLLFLGLVASLFCFVIWNMAVKRLGTVRTNNYIYFVPLVALASSALVLHETVTVVALAGAVLILGGVYAAEKGGGTKPKNDAYDE